MLLYIFRYVCIHALPLCYSVWDALTDNYISAWDNPDPEGLNGNLSDQEVRSIFIFNQS